MVMHTVTVTDIAIAIPTSIIMAMAMAMGETKIKKFKTYYFLYQKTTALRWFFKCDILLIIRKIILVETLESIPIEFLIFLKGLSF